MSQATPVIVVATLTAKPESVEVVRDICTRTVAQVHDEPGCQLYALHESDGAFVFIEQWADADALRTHAAASAAAMFAQLEAHLAGKPDIKMLQSLPAGDPAKGLLRQ